MLLKAVVTEVVDPGQNEVKKAIEVIGPELCRVSPEEVFNLIEFGFETHILTPNARPHWRGAADVRIVN